MSIKLNSTDALIIVDVQKDFCSGGALEVPDGDAVVPVINKYIALFQKACGMILATRDWHPYNHSSFKEYGGPWPPHCIQNTTGAEFHPHLQLPADYKLVSLAEKPGKDAYSGFEGTNLNSLLQERSIKRVFVCGLATDYCVKATALDAVALNYETYLLEDAVRGVNVRPDDSEKAIRKMEERGVKRTTLAQLSAG